MSVASCSSLDEFTSTGSELLAGFISKSISQKGRCVLALPGGRSVSGILEKLALCDIEWDKVHIFLVDERFVLYGDKESNFSLIEEHFLDRLGSAMPADNIHPFIDKKITLEKINNEEHHSSILHRYAEELEEVGGEFDVVLLSAGEDGHIGGLFPDHVSILNSNDEKFISFDDSPKPPALRMSSSRSLLSKSTYGVLLFLGEGKKKAFEQFSNTSLPIEQCPAKLVSEMKQWRAITFFS